MTFVVDALATFRLTRLVNQDTITEGLRAKVKHAMYQETRSAELAAKLDVLISCPWCVSWWVALGVITARRVAPKAWQPVATALALSAVTGLVAENLD